MSPDTAAGGTPLSPQPIPKGPPCRYCGRSFTGADEEFCSLAHRELFQRERFVYYQPPPEVKKKAPVILLKPRPKPLAIAGFLDADLPEPVKGKTRTWREPARMRLSGPAMPESEKPEPEEILAGPVPPDLPPKAPDRMIMAGARNIIEFPRKPVIPPFWRSLRCGSLLTAVAFTRSKAQLKRNEPGTLPFPRSFGEMMRHILGKQNP